MSFIIRRPGKEGDYNEDLNSKGRFSMSNGDFHHHMGVALDNGWSGRTEVDEKFPNENYEILDFDEFRKALKSVGDDTVNQKYLAWLDTVEEDTVIAFQ